MHSLLDRGNLKISEDQLAHFTNLSLNRQIEIIFILYWVEQLEAREIKEKVNLDGKYPTGKDQRNRIQYLLSKFPTRYFTPIIPSEDFEAYSQNKVTAKSIAKKHGISVPYIYQLIKKEGITKQIDKLPLTHPHITELFLKEENAPVTPHDLTYGDDKTKHWWKCPTCGKKFLATVFSRTKTRRPDCGSCGLKRGIFGVEWYNWEILGGDITLEEHPDCKLAYKNRYLGMWEGELRAKIPDATFTDTDGLKVARDFKLDGEHETIRSETIPKYACDFDRIEIACRRNPQENIYYIYYDTKDDKDSYKVIPIDYLAPQQLIERVKEKREVFTQRLKKLRKERIIPFDDQEGLDNALAYLQNVYNSTGTIPNPYTSDDKTLRLILKAVKRGAWLKSGIRKGKWSDLKKRVIGDIFTDDQEGLDNALTYLQNLYNSTGTIPNPRNSDDKTLRLIFKAVRRGVGVKFGIRKGKWSDLKNLSPENNQNTQTFEI